MGKHSIIVIKNNNNEYLQKYIDSWNSYLFLNCKVKDEEDIDTIKKYIKDELNVDDIEIKYIDQRTHRKFSEKDKIEKEYTHYFYKVEIKEEYVLPSNYKWFSMDKLKQDERIMSVNSDIIGYINDLEL